MSNRRQFVKQAATISAAFMIVPRHVLGKGFVAPSDKLYIAGIGIGGEGEDDLRAIAKSPNVEIAFLCDVDDVRAKGDVGNEMAIHDVEMYPIGAGLDRVGDFLAQLREIGGENGWRDADRAGHGLDSLWFGA